MVFCSQLGLTKPNLRKKQAATGYNPENWPKKAMFVTGRGLAAFGRNQVSQAFQPDVSLTFSSSPGTHLAPVLRGEGPGADRENWAYA